jgi:hypothetical protein
MNREADTHTEFSHGDQLQGDTPAPAPAVEATTTATTLVDLLVPTVEASAPADAAGAPPPADDTDATGEDESTTSTPPITAAARPNAELRSVLTPGPVVIGQARAASLHSYGRDGLFKLGIVGGKGTGKSYLFQAMVYRCQAAARAGALSRFIDGGSLRLFEAATRAEGLQPVNLRDFVRHYQRWNRLPFTTLDNQRWYRLEFPYRVGWLGRGLSMLDVEFFDGSGEAFFAGALDAQNRRIWREGFLHANVMVFCLPFWAAFPGSLTEADRAWRERFLRQFEDVVHNFNHVREVTHTHHPVRSILALTMADDVRHGWPELQARWMRPYREAPRTYERRLRRAGALAAYLANARSVSRLVHNALIELPDPFVASIPGKLHFGAGEPWVVPLSAIDGQTLEHLEASGVAAPEDDFPVPVHVELPLLVALCERTNALM